MMLEGFIQKIHWRTMLKLMSYNVAGSPTAQSVGGFLTGINPKNPDPSQE